MNNNIHNKKSPIPNNKSPIPNAIDIAWTTEKSLELARLLEVNRCLWDRSDDGYKKRIVRYSAIENIRKELSMEHTVVEAKLKAIIGQFQREMKKEGKTKSGSGAGEGYKSKWFLYEPLKFLSNITSIRATFTLSMLLTAV